MPDKYTEKQLNYYEKGTPQSPKDDALYRLGDRLEVVPCSNANLTPEQRDIVLNAAKGG